MITTEQYRRFFKNVLDTLEGDWVLTGGALVAILVPHSRVTMDIDLCPIGELTNERRIALMKIAEASGMSIEAINPAADFFLRQIPDWQKSIVLQIRGAKGSLYRPSLYLYIRMKVGRLSESDVEDCLTLTDWHRRSGVTFDAEEIRDFLIEKKRQESDLKKQNLLAKIVDAL